MTIETITVKIDRSQRREVDKHIKEVFIKLQKKKTEKLLAAYYQWYKARPELSSKELIEFDAIPRKNKEDFERPNSKKTVDRVYGDKYAATLAKFTRANRLHERELIRIAEDLKDLSQFEGRNKLGFCKTLSSAEIDLLKDVFKLLRLDSGVVNVTAVSKREKNAVLKSFEDKSCKSKLAASIEKPKPFGKVILKKASSPSFESFSKKGVIPDCDDVLECKTSKAKKDETETATQAEVNDTAAEESEKFVTLPKVVVDDLTSKLSSLALSAKQIGAYC